MRRYEFSDGQSHKFWEITLDGASLRIRFGRVGSDGQARTKEFESAGEAREAHARTIAEKLEAGYHLVYNDDPGEVTAAEPRNPELEAAILAAPDDPRPYLALGDWLQQQRDPRGQLITLQHELRQEKAPGRFLELRRAEQALIQEHGRPLLGDLLPHLPHLKLEWRLGFLRRVTLAPERGALEDPAAVLEALLSHPSARFLAELEVRLPGLDEAAHRELWEPLEELRPVTLRKLSFGEPAPRSAGPGRRAGRAAPGREEGEDGEEPAAPLAEEEEEVEVEVDDDDDDAGAGAEEEEQFEEIRE